MKKYFALLCFAMTFWSTQVFAEMNRRNVCRADMVTYRGRVLRVFRTRGRHYRQACRNAMWRCRRVLRRRQSRGRNRYARCVIRRYRDRDWDRGRDRDRDRDWDRGRDRDRDHDRDRDDDWDFDN